MYVGNFSENYCTEVQIARTLEKMGHEVIPFQEDRGPNALSRSIPLDIDLFLFTKTWGFTVQNEHLEILRGLGVPTASYHLDLYIGLKRQSDLDTDPFWRTDFVFTPDGDAESAKIFKEKGINHFYIKPGVDAAECSLLARPKTHALIFVGSVFDYHPEWQYRTQLHNWLLSNYQGRYELWGPHGQGLVRNEALNELLASTKITIGDSLHLPNHDYYWSDRVYETLGRGGFLIHPYIKGMEEEFVGGKHLVYYEYGNWEQLRQLIDHYLSDENEEEREAIRLAGHEYVIKHATYDQRLAQAFKIMKLNTKQKTKSEMVEV